MILVVDDRDREEVAVGQEAGGGLLVGGRLDADGRRRHQLDDRRVGGAQHQPIEREHAEEVPLGVDDVDVADGLGLVDERPDGRDRLRRPGLPRDGDVLGRHQAAGRVWIVVRQRPDLGRVLGPHPDEDLVDVRVGQVLDDVGRVVGVHPAQDDCGLVRAERPEDRGRDRRVELLEDLRDLLVRQPLEEDRNLVRVELRDQVGPVGRADAFGEAADAFLLPLADQLLQLVAQRIACRVHHRWVLRAGDARSGSPRGDVRGTVVGPLGVAMRRAAGPTAAGS